MQGKAGSAIVCVCVRLLMSCMCVLFAGYIREVCKAFKKKYEQESSDEEAERKAAPRGDEASDRFECALDKWSGKTQKKEYVQVDLEGGLEKTGLAASTHRSKCAATNDPLQTLACPTRQAKQ